MQEKERGVIVVGGGPAGAICASYLAKEGVDVLLLDKSIFPREKPCGDMIGEGFSVHMESLEIMQKLDKMSTFIKKVELISNRGREGIIPFECYCLQRARLDMLLLDTASKWGAEIKQGCQVTDVIEEDGYVKGVKVRYGACETEIRSKMVIGADGATSQVAKSLGIMKENSFGRAYGQRAYFEKVKFKKNLVGGQYDAYGVFSFDELVKPGYFWVIPVGEKGVSDGCCNVGMTISDRKSFKGMSLTESFNQWIKKNPVIAYMFEDAKQISPWLGGELADASQNMKHSGNGYMLIGDAAALMMPLRRDGLSVAADSAKEAAEIALKALTKGDCSEGFLLSVTEEKNLTDALKDDILMVQSMYDTELMDKVIMRNKETL